jgi:PAS domain S-box-containing protein
MDSKMNANTGKQREVYRNTVFDAADDIAFITTDLDGIDARILDFSPGAEHVFGYRREEIIGQKFSVLYGEENGSIDPKLFTRVDPKKPGLTREVFLVRKSGEKFPTIFTRYPIQDEEGNLTATLGVAVDVSQKKRWEAAIRSANSELRQLFNTAVDGMRVIDQKYNMLRVSETFLRLSQTTKEEVKGKKCYEVLCGPLCHTDMCPLRRILAGKEHIECEIEKKCRDGTKIPCILTATPFKGTDGELLGIVEHFKDITVRKKSSDRLQKSEYRYSKVVENSLTGIYIEIKGRIDYVNYQFANIFGSNRDELIGMKIQDLIHPNFQEFTQEIRAKLILGLERTAEFEVKCLTLDNQTIWAKVREVRIDYEGKQAILGNLVEITERKRIVEALRESEKTLKVLSSHLFTAQEDERKRLAHELHDGIGQSLSAIKFCAENHLKHLASDLEGESSASLEKIIALTQNAIEEVRKISMDLRPSTLDDLGILPTIAWFCREFQLIYSQIRIEQHIDIRENEVPLSIKTVMFRVLQEALNNVGRHSQADVARLSLRKTESHIELVIEDNGIGFDLAESHATRSLLKGFGLAGMRERVEFSGGVFIVMPMRGAGTFIRAKWPVQQALSNA